MHTQLLHQHAKILKCVRTLYIHLTLKFTIHNTQSFVTLKKEREQNFIFHSGKLLVTDREKENTYLHVLFYFWIIISSPYQSFCCIKCVCRICNCLTFCWHSNKPFSIYKSNSIQQLLQASNETSAY